jgi:hypothetical protein
MSTAVGALARHRALLLATRVGRWYRPTREGIEDIASIRVEDDGLARTV